VAAYFVSGLGSAMSVVAIPWLVLIMTGSAAATGAIGFAQMAPYVALQATAGPLVDRIGLRRSFLLGNTLAAVAMGGLNLGVLAALVAVAGAVRGIADAATTPLVPATAEASCVPIERATGSYSAANRTALLVGMPLVGVLITATGAASVVLIDGLSFVAAVVILATFVRAAAITTIEQQDEPLKLRTYICELAEGCGSWAPAGCCWPSSRWSRLRTCSRKH
jgi:MFS family permease